VKVIAFTGAAGAGKTTLAKALAYDGSRTYVRAPTRDFYAKKGLTEQELRLRPLDEQIQFQDELTSFAMEWWRTLEGKVVTDRTPIDYLAYWLMLNHGVSSAAVMDRVGAVRELMAPADVMGLFCPWPVPWVVETDGFRAGEGQNWTISALIEKIIHEGQIPILYLKSLPLRERVLLVRGAELKLSAPKQAV